MSVLLCQQCGRENEEGRRFCIYCGAALPPAETAPAAAEVAELRGTLLNLRRLLQEFEVRIQAVEAARGVAAATPPTAAPPPTPPPEAAAPPLLVTTPEGQTIAVERPPAGPPPGGPPEGPAVLPEARRWDWEQVLGVNWFARIGALALVLGVGFFLRMAFENNWIGDTGKVAIGIVSGLALLGAGDYWQRRYPLWTQAVTGAGIAILYLSIYAAFAFYHLIPDLPAFGFLALVTLTAGVLALRHESRFVALLGIASGFLTPFMLRQAGLDERLLLGYTLVLDLGILGLASFRNWRWMVLLGLLGTLALFGAWYSEFYRPDKLLLAEGALTLFFLTFVGATTLFHVLWRRAPKAEDMLLMTLNAAAYFGISYGLLQRDHRDWLGGFALSLAFFYGLVAYAALKRRGVPAQVPLFALAVALVFLTIAMPLQLTGRWITIAWATEGAVLTWVGFTLRNPRLRAFAWLVFAVMAFRLMAFDTPIQLADFRLVLNERFLTFAIAVASLYLVGYLYRRDGPLAEWEPALDVVYFVAANFFTLWLLTFEAMSYFDSQAIAATERVNGTLLTLTALWTLYAMGLLVLAMRRRSRLLRLAGLALLAISVLKIITQDTFRVRLDPHGFLLFLNPYFIVFLLVVAAVYLAAYSQWRVRAELAETERFFFPALLGIASFLSLWMLSVEAIHFFDSSAVVQRADLANAKSLSLTLIWALYAIGVIAVGMLRRWRLVRLFGTALLAIPVAKLFVLDVFLLTEGYRAAAFVALGVLLLAMGFVYARFGRAVRGFFLE